MTDNVQYIAINRDLEFSIYFKDAAGAAIDQTGRQYRVRIFSKPGTVALDLTWGAGVSLGDASAGRIDVAVVAASMGITASSGASGEVVRTDTGADVYGTWPIRICAEGEVPPSYCNGVVTIQTRADIVITAANAPAGPQGVPGPAVSDGDKGDITVSGSGTVYTIDNDAVTNAKLRNSSALSVIGRSANSTGDPADIATAADYDVLRRSGTTLGFGKVDSRSLMGGGDFVNMVQNPRFEQGDIGWVKGAGWAISSDPSNSLSGNYVAINTSTSGAVTAFDSNTFDVAPGDILYGEVWIKTAPGVTMTLCRAQIYWFDKDLAMISNATGNNFTTDQASYVKSSVTTGAMPSNAAYAYFRVLVAKTVGTVYANNVVVLKKRDGGQLISKFSTAQVFEVTDNSNAAVRITQLGTGDALVVEDSANPDSTPWKVNASGNVVHGYTGQIAIAGANYFASVLASGSGYPQAFGYTAASATGPMVSFVKSRNADWSARAAVNNGDVLGGFYFAADDGTDLASIAASIQATIDAAPGTDDVPGRLTFATTADGGNSPTNRLRIDSSGNILNVSTGGLGFGTGSGGAVTQATNRTTGVTLNKSNGAITLVSAAGSTSWQSFTVTNATVADTDVVIVSQKSGTDLYELHVTAVAAGSFRISYRTTGGTTTEQPVFNFAVIKAVTA